MINECKIVRDILPLYFESMISDETKAFVDEHLKSCSDCKNELTNMGLQVKLPADISAVPLKTVKRQLLIKRIKTAICAMAVVATVMLSLFAVFTAPQYLPYSDKLLSFAENENGGLICTFEAPVTGYRVDKDIQLDSEYVVYFIEAWSSVWDQDILSRSLVRNFELEPVNGKEMVVYYSPNNGEESILVYNSNPHESPDWEGIVVLPRLFLNYYFIIAVFVFVLLLVLLLKMRKNDKWKQRITKILPLPGAYLISHLHLLIIGGVYSLQYSPQRDLAFIVLGTVFLYLVFSLLINLYQSENAADKQ